MPARKKRIPAKRICELLSFPAISNIRYPVLIQGNALPQRAQQIKAPIHTTHVFFKKSVDVFMFFETFLLFFLKLMK